MTSTLHPIKTHPLSYKAVQLVNMTNCTGIFKLNCSEKPYSFSVLWLMDQILYHNNKATHAKRSFIRKNRPRDGP